MQSSQDCLYLCTPNQMLVGPGSGSRSGGEKALGPLLVAGAEKKKKNYGQGIADCKKLLTFALP
ncbi:hypothetical protein, partial [Pontibacter deserti]|uniref:hypothetical protein n=1 Tax=Pontibacter sp. KCTC 32443 TaxID=2764721 RepID=UPI001C9B798B